MSRATREVVGFERPCQDCPDGADRHAAVLCRRHGAAASNGLVDTAARCIEVCGSGWKQMMRQMWLTYCRVRDEPPGCSGSPKASDGPSDNGNDSGKPLDDGQAYSRFRDCPVRGI